MHAIDLIASDVFTNKTIRELWPGPLPQPSKLEQQPFFSITAILADLDGRSAVRLLTSCRRYMKISLYYSLFDYLLRRDFPAPYSVLANRVFKEKSVGGSRGLLLYRLYALNHGPDPRILGCRMGRVMALFQLAHRCIVTGFRKGS